MKVILLVLYRMLIFWMGYSIARFLWNGRGGLTQPRLKESSSDHHRSQKDWCQPGVVDCLLDYRESGSKSRRRNGVIFSQSYSDTLSRLAQEKRSHGIIDPLKNTFFFKRKARLTEVFLGCFLFSYLSWKLLRILPEKK